MDFDPEKISYEQLLAVFWASHHPGSPLWSRQYMNAVFYHNEAQQRLALASKKQIAEKTKGEVYTQVLPAAGVLPGGRLPPEVLSAAGSTTIRRTAPDLSRRRRLRQFHVAARLNGYLAGYGH